MQAVERASYHRLNRPGVFLGEVAGHDQRVGDVRHLVLRQADQHVHPLLDEQIGVRLVLHGRGYLAALEGSKAGWRVANLQLRHVFARNDETPLT